MSQNKNRLLTPKKAKELYGIEPGKVYNWVRHRKFKFMKPDKEILFWEKDLLDFLSKYEIPANGESR
ncbi:MAG TPA: helix-turn-helix domain-containing protein [Thermodesulfobacteriota bacterium]|nr:helix-turn-helix domain-containing protein [Thermodesulfobacteriota bacterium]